MLKSLVRRRYCSLLEDFYKSDRILFSTSLWIQNHSPQNRYYRDQKDAQPTDMLVKYPLTRINWKEPFRISCGQQSNYFSTINCQRCSNKPSVEPVDSNLDAITYEKVCTETLDSLNDYFEQLLENITDEDEEYLKQFKNSDISYSVSRATCTMIYC